MPDITIIVSTYHRNKSLDVLIRSFLCQTCDDWRMLVFHDGPGDDFVQHMAQYDLGPKLEWRLASQHNGDWGHSLRAMALDEVETKYLIWTNDDNYYVPTFLETMLGAAKDNNFDLVFCDMIHNDRQYQPVKARLRRGHIDIGSFIIKTKLAKEVGFNHRDYAADWHFLVDVFEHGHVNAGHVNQTLFVHN